MEVLRVDRDRPDAAAVARAGAVLRGGGLVAFPTETVYGLGAHARSSPAVERIYAAKGRPPDNPLIVHVMERDGLASVAASVPPLAVELAERFWPGPLTLVVDAAEDLPEVTTGGLSTVAVRMPDHPVALAVLRAARVPVAAPSANRSGRPSPTIAAHVVADLADAVDLVVDGGPADVGIESTVVDARGPQPVVLREGAVTREQLGGACTGATDSPASPGTRYRHYAPACRVDIAPRGQGPRRAGALARGGQRVGLVATAPGPEGVRTLATVRDAADLGRRLYDVLRAAEAAGVDVVVVEAVVETGIGRAVMDRLRRAAAS